MTKISLEKSLIDYLKQVPDERNTNGQRHPLWLISLIIIIGMLSGHGGYRSMGRFVARHRRQLISALKIPQARVPSYSTIRRVMMNLNYNALAQVFNDWASQYTHRHNNQWVAFDDKSLKNTVSESHNSQQNFFSMISAFSYERGEVLGIQIVENKQKSEIVEDTGSEVIRPRESSVVVQDLLELLDLKNIVFSMDALHCQKKLSAPSSLTVTTI